LLADIVAKNIDVIVVYKVDRLTRSLSDFARIVDLFDSHGVFFVSVTQQFNTTTSMGRLTLNVLLSFAQFEREITSERIRDKIAASKKKGMWMGGNVPLGFVVEGRELVADKIETEKVRFIYNRYTELKSVRKLYTELVRDKVHTQVRKTERGSVLGVKPISSGNIYRMLQNPIYIGKVVHKGTVYEGLHDGIIDHELWTRVQQLISENRNNNHLRPRAAKRSLLAGYLFDDNGIRLSPSHCNKKGVRYRYYISNFLLIRRIEDRPKNKRSRRIPADEIEKLVIYALASILKDQANLTGLLAISKFGPTRVKKMLDVSEHYRTQLNGPDGLDARIFISKIIDRIVVSENCVVITIKLMALGRLLDVEWTEHDSDQLGSHDIELPIRVTKRGVEQKLIITDRPVEKANHDPILERAVARAYVWFNELKTGQSRDIASIARRENVPVTPIKFHLQPVFLAPDIVRAIMEGRQPVDLTASRLLSQSDLPLEWSEQRRQLGFC